MNATAPAIVVRDLRKHYGAVVAVDGLDLEIQRGECFGILGPNGAGKTTTIEILEGINQPTSGSVEVLGLRWDRDAAALRERIGISLQETKFGDHLTVEETVEVFRSLYSKGLSVADAMARVQLTEKRNAPVRTLSGGQHQRLAIACAIAGRPDILFLDEPTTGLDPQSRRALWDVLLELRNDKHTIILTTHYMEEAERLCDRIAIVDQGKVIALGTPRGLIEESHGDQLITFSTDPPIDPAKLADLPTVSAPRASGDEITMPCRSIHLALPALLQLLEEQGCTLTRLSTRQVTLEDTFVALTGRRLRDR